MPGESCVANFSPDEVQRERLAECLRIAAPGQSTDAATAAAAAREALDLARSLTSGADEYRAAAWLTRHWLHLGRMSEALELADRVLQKPMPPGMEDARIEALRVVTLAASEYAQFERALGAAEELMQLAASQGGAGMLAAAVALAIPFERMGNSWQAQRILSQALAEHGAQSPAKDILSAGNALCAVCTRIVHLLRDEGADTELAAVLAQGRQAGERALAMLEQTPHPVYEAIIGVNLAELLIGEGKYEQARGLLERLQASAQAQQLQVLGWYVEVNLADALLRLGLAAEALALACRVIESGAQAVPHATLAKAHLVAYGASKALADFETALKHFELAERLERQVMTQHLRSQSELFVTRTEELRARHAATSAQLEAQQERHRAAEFAAQAEQDPLTGLGNRRHLERRIADVLPALSQEAAPLALAQIDVDLFKRVNDTHGHAAGDQVLVALAKLLRDNSRASDIVVRSGGEEFVMVLPNSTPAVATEVCERLRARVQATPVDIGSGVTLSITVSIGIAAAPPYDLDALMRRADEALYAAKQGGRNRLGR
jgi:diguanylate cyclase (GGDEF)-like protein